MQVLTELLPPPLRWTSVMRCCDVVQAAHARLPGLDRIGSDRLPGPSLAALDVQSGAIRSNQGQSGPSLTALDDVIEKTLVPWLMPHFVFVQ